MSNAKQTETRQLRVSPNIIYSLIKNQAGTLAKAVLECAMNSFDAGATKIDITVNNKTMRVVDDGRGFATRDEILACFEEFGFEHVENDTKFGKFGIGRAQLWNFCKTKWRTRTFSMDVDIKNKGFDYTLVEALKDQEGLVIDGTFYTPLKTSEVMAFEKEFASLAMYMSVPVTVNGKLISKDPRKEKWTHETADAWIHIRESGNLQVYNLGVFVREYPSYQVGCGGKVVTKPGVRLTLNMARNDIILTECKVWKRIKPFLQNESDKRIKDTKRKLTTAEIDNLATRFIAGEIHACDIKDVKFITDISGKAYTFDYFLRKSKGKPIITGVKDSQVLDRANQMGLAVVLADETLARFGVDSPKELGELLYQMAESHRFTHSTWHLDGLKWEDDAKQVTDLLCGDHVVLQDNELTKEEKAILEALSHASSGIAYVVTREYRSATRKIVAGTSDVALAWTDGAHTIAFERRQLKLARKGMPGMQALINIMVHEYLHDTNSAGSHMHDEEFKDSYHELMTDPKTAEAIASSAEYAFRSMLKLFRDKDIPLIKALKDSIDIIDAGAMAAVDAPVADNDALATKVAVMKKREEPAKAGRRTKKVA